MRHHTLKNGRRTTAAGGGAAVLPPRLRRRRRISSSAPPASPAGVSSPDKREREREVCVWLGFEEKMRKMGYNVVFIVRI